MTRKFATDQGEQKLLDDIEQYGWHCMHILEEGDLPPFSYTVGFHKTFGCSELIIYGLESDVAHSVLNIAAKAAAGGSPIDLTTSTDRLLNGFDCMFVEVPKSKFHEHFGFALWYYEGDEFPVYQMVWPNREGLYPWNPSCTDAFRAAQPVLGHPHNVAKIEN